MKQIVVYLLMSTMCLFVVEAQNKALRKAIKKEYKAKIKEYKRRVGKLQLLREVWMYLY